MREWRVGRRESRQSHTIVMLATARLVSATLPMFARGFGPPSLPAHLGSLPSGQTPAGGNWGPAAGPVTDPPPG